MKFKVGDLVCFTHFLGNIFPSDKFYIHEIKDDKIVNLSSNKHYEYLVSTYNLEHYEVFHSPLYKTLDEPS